MRQYSKIIDMKIIFIQWNSQDCLEGGSNMKCVFGLLLTQQEYMLLDNASL